MRVKTAFQRLIALVTTQPKVLMRNTWESVRCSESVIKRSLRSLIIFAGPPLTIRFAAMKRFDLLTEEEFARFSGETRDVITALLRL